MPLFPPSYYERRRSLSNTLRTLPTIKITRATPESTPPPFIPPAPLPPTTTPQATQATPTLSSSSYLELPKELYVIRREQRALRKKSKPRINPSGASSKKPPFPKELVRPKPRIPSKVSREPLLEPSPSSSSLKENNIKKNTMFANTGSAGGKTTPPAIRKKHTQTQHQQRNRTIAAAESSKETKQPAQKAKKTTSKLSETVADDSNKTSSNTKDINNTPTTKQFERLSKRTRTTGDEEDNSKDGAGIRSIPPPPPSQSLSPPPPPPPTRSPTMSRKKLNNSTAAKDTKSSGKQEGQRKQAEKTVGKRGKNKKRSCSNCKTTSSYKWTTLSDRTLCLKCSAFEHILKRNRRPQDLQVDEAAQDAQMKEAIEVYENRTKESTFRKEQRMAIKQNMKKDQENKAYSSTRSDVTPTTSTTRSWVDQVNRIPENFRTGKFEDSDHYRDQWVVFEDEQLQAAGDGDLSGNNNNRGDMNNNSSTVGRNSMRMGTRSNGGAVAGNANPASVPAPRQQLAPRSLAQQQAMYAESSTENSSRGTEAMDISEDDNIASRKSGREEGEISEGSNGNQIRLSGNEHLNISSLNSESSHNNSGSSIPAPIGSRNNTQLTSQNVPTTPIGPTGNPQLTAQSVTQPSTAANPTGKKRRADSSDDDYSTGATPPKKLKLNRSYGSVLALSDAIRSDISALERITNASPRNAPLRFKISDRIDNLVINLTGDVFKAFLKTEQEIRGSELPEDVKEELIGANLDGCLSKGDWRMGPL